MLRVELLKGLFLFNYVFRLNVIDKEEKFKDMETMKYSDLVMAHSLVDIISSYPKISMNLVS